MNGPQDPTDAPEGAAEHRHELLTRLATSRGKVDAAQAEYQALRRLLPSLMNELSQRVSQEHSASLMSRESLATTGEMIQSMNQAVTRLMKSTQEEHQVLTALLNDPQSLSKVGASMVSTTTPAANASAQSVVDSENVGPISPPLAPSAQIVIRQIVDALRRIIEKEVERQLKEKLDPMRQQVEELLRQR